MSLPGSVEGQLARVFGHPGLVEGVPAHGRGFGKRWPIRSLPTQTSLWFYDTNTKDFIPMYQVISAFPASTLTEDMIFHRWFYWQSLHLHSERQAAQHLQWKASKSKIAFLHWYDFSPSGQEVNLIICLQLAVDYDEW